MRLIIARCSVSYRGRGETELAEAVRLIMVKNDGSVSIHSDDRAFKPLNWMLPPALIDVTRNEDGSEDWLVSSRKETIAIHVTEVLSDVEHTLEESEPGLVRSWTEPHIQAWLASHVEMVFGEGWTLVRREYPTGAGPVDLLVRNEFGAAVAVEVKRTANMSAVDQVGRYVEALNLLEETRPCTGIVIALDVKPRARELAEARGVVWMEIPQHLFRETV